MAKSQHTFMKRQREIEKRKKATAKREKREEKKNMPAGSGPEVVSYVVNHGMVIGSAEGGLRPQRPSTPHVQRVEEMKEESEGAKGPENGKDADRQA